MKLNWKMILCSIFGHPRVVDYCFGYQTCARCDFQLGDSLGGVGIDAREYVVKGHDCKKCRKNWKRLKVHEKIGVGKVFEK